MSFANLTCITFVLIAWCTVHPSLLMLPLLLVALLFVSTPPNMLRQVQVLFLNLTIVYACLLILLNFSSSLPAEHVTSNGIYDLDFRLGSLLRLGESSSKHFAVLIDLVFFSMLVFMWRFLSAGDFEDDEEDLEFGHVEESYMGKFIRLTQLFSQQCTFFVAIVLVFAISLSSVDAIHAIYLIFCGYFSIASDRKRVHRWRYLVLYSCLVTMALFVTSGLFGYVATQHAHLVTHTHTHTHIQLRNRVRLSELQRNLCVLPSWIRYETLPSL